MPSLCKNCVQDVNVNGQKFVEVHPHLPHRSAHKTHESTLPMENLGLFPNKSLVRTQAFPQSKLSCIPLLFHYFSKFSPTPITTTTIYI